MEKNLEIYEKCRQVPDSAKKTIGAGRLKGMTDINPMWRIQKLTEMYGPCGTGWYYTIDKEWLEECENGEVAAFMDISLYVKQDGEWSKPIPGTGGSKFTANEKSGLYMSDECYKMALTDAISVSCKALGMGADVYWGNGRTKYSAPPPDLTPNVYETDKKGELRAALIQACKKDAEKANAACEKRFGKSLMQLDEDELQEALALALSKAG